MSFWKHCLIIAVLSLGLGQTASAWDRRMGARPMGMGDAFSALADDVNALNYNPSGLARLESLEASLEYASLYTALDDGRIQENHLALAWPLGSLNGLGLGWNNRGVVDVYNENELVLGYALQPGKTAPLRLGLAVKLFYWTYTDSAFLSLSRSLGLPSEKYQYGLDAGVLYTLWKESASVPEISAAFCMININQPDLGLSAYSPLPAETRLGLAAQWQDWDGALDAVWLNTRLQIHGGAEKWFQQRQWGVRAGFMSGQDTGTTATLGAGYGFAGSAVKVRLVYAFNYALNGIQETWGTHRLSLDFEFPKSAPQTAREPVHPSDTSAAHRPATAQLEKIRTYLFERMDEYFAALETVIRLQTQNPKNHTVDLARAKAQLHEAAGSLIIRENILEFLQHLETALTILKSIESGQ